MTVKALAEASGVSRRFLALLEQGQGNISVARLEQVARALDVPIAELLVEDGQGAGSRGIEWKSDPASRATGPPFVALLGVRGAGKSSVGRAVAERLGRRFVELDALVEEDAGLSLGEIFAVHGADYYRRVEARVLEALLASRPDAPGVVIATGGSLVTHADSWALLRREALCVWLHAHPRDHWERVLAQGDTRPMGQNPHAFRELEVLLEVRAPLYAQGDRRVDTGGRPFEGVVAEVEGVIRSSGAG